MQFAAPGEARLCAAMRNFRSCFAVLLLTVMAACATPPEPAAPFPERLVAAEAAGNPYEVDAALTVLLADPALAPADRAEAYYQRGSLRRLAGDDRRGAVADLQQVLTIMPTHPRAAQAKVELELTRSDLEALEPRLNYMLTLPQWFDVAWALGERDVPARRYQVSGISPTADQIRKLKDAGFVCGADGAGGPVQGAGEPREWLEGLTWCRPLPTVTTEPEPASTE
jgi:hypothetical protein